MKTELVKPQRQTEADKVFLYIGEGCEVGGSCGSSGNNCSVGATCKAGDDC